MLARTTRNPCAGTKPPPNKSKGHTGTDPNHKRRGWRCLSPPLFSLAKTLQNARVG